MKSTPAQQVLRVFEIENVGRDAKAAAWASSNHGAIDFGRHLRGGAEVVVDAILMMSGFMAATRATISRLLRRLAGDDVA